MGSVGAEITVFGMVQGVGFRYFCFRLANDLNLVGWVKNNPDGSVTTSIEGDSGAVESYIKELKIGSSYSKVTNIEIKYLPVTGNFKNFDIIT